MSEREFIVGVVYGVVGLSMLYLPIMAFLYKLGEIKGMMKGSK